MIFAKKLTDLQIKEGILQCDLKVYKYLDKRFRPKTVAHVKANSGSMMDAEELYNSVVWQIYQNIEEGKYEVEEGKFGAYFARIMQYKWKDVLRYRNRKKQVNTTELTSVVENKAISNYSDTAGKMLLTKCLSKHINELKDQDRKLIKLFYYDGLKQFDVAEKIGMTSDYVKQRMHKIRRRLKTKLIADPDFINL